MKAKEFEVKPRNFVAKNAKMGGAGQHKDKKKAEKQGDVKHKQKLVPMETIEQKLSRKIQENLAEGERQMSRAAKGNEKYGKDGMKALAKAGREGASEKKLDAIRDKHDKYDESIEEAEKKGLYYYVNKRKKAGTSRDASSPKAPTAQAWKDAAKTAKKEGVAEEFKPEYDDEAGMSDNNLETLKRSVAGIDELIQPGDNLPEWCQEKIAIANSMLVTVWDYMLSEKESEAGRK